MFWAVNNLTLQFLDGESEDDEMTVVYGFYPRPVLWKVLPKLVIWFQPDVEISNRATNIGFKATYRFLPGMSPKNISMVATLRKKATIHHMTTRLPSLKISYFQVLTTC